MALLLRTWGIQSSRCSEEGFHVQISLGNNQMDNARLTGWAVLTSLDFRTLKGMKFNPQFKELSSDVLHPYRSLARS